MSVNKKRLTQKPGHSAATQYLERNFYDARPRYNLSLQCTVEYLTKKTRCQFITTDGLQSPYTTGGFLFILLMLPKTSECHIDEIFYYNTQN